MHLRSVIAISVTSLVAGYMLHLVQQRIVSPSFPEPRKEMNARTMRVDYPLRSTGQASAFTDQAAADVFKNMQQAGTDQEQRNALFALIPPREISSLLAKLKARAGFDGLDYEDREALRGLLTTWYLKSPAAALAWLQCVDNASERNKMLGRIAEDLADKDLNAAMDLLRKQGLDRLGIEAFSSGLFNAALGKGVNEMLEVCRLGLYCGPHRGSSSDRVTYPEGFDFQRALDGLADMKAGFGDDAKFMALPSDLVGEWSKRNPHAAWAWLQQDKSVDGSGRLEFFSSFATMAEPAEVAALLAADFRPEAPAKDRYENILWVLDEHPLPEMIDAILAAVPGDREENLQELLDERAGFTLDTEDIDPASKLILERMKPEQRLTGLRRIFSHIDSGPFDLKDAARKGITPLLLRMGHSQEEIASLFPPDEEK